MPMNGFIRAWERFWFRDASPLPLAVFRIAFALCLLREIEQSRRLHVFAIEGGFHLPYAPFPMPVSPEVFHALHAVQYPLVALLLLGLFTRLAAGSLFAIQGFLFFADQLNFRNHPYFFWLVLGVLAWSPAGRALSVDAWRRCRSWREAVRGSAGPVAAQRLLQLQLVIVYAYAVLHKLHPAYLDGRVLTFHFAQDLAVENLRALLGADMAERIRALTADPGSMVPLAVATLALEAGLPVFLWFRRTRVAAAIAGAIFHLGIAFTMNIWTFSFAMIASYVLFIWEPARSSKIAASRRDCSRR
jgi:hypothetical protein